MSLVNWIHSLSWMFNFGLLTSRLFVGLVSLRQLRQGVRLELGGAAIRPEFLSSGWSEKGSALAFLSVIENLKLTKKQGLAVLSLVRERERRFARLAVRRNGIFNSKAMALFARCQPCPISTRFLRVFRGGQGGAAR